VTPRLTGPDWTTLHEICKAGEKGISSFIKGGRLRSVPRLKAAGYVEACPPPQMHFIHQERWRITAAGRAALAEHDKARKRDV
jgi:hypothetical protein